MQTMDSLPYERSPVFLQALDATYQILRQYPRHFEFSSELLLFIADHVHSGQWSVIGDVGVSMITFCFMHTHITHTYIQLPTIHFKRIL